MKIFHRFFHWCLNYSLYKTYGMNGPWTSPWFHNRYLLVSSFGYSPFQGVRFGRKRERERERERERNGPAPRLKLPALELGLGLGLEFELSPVNNLNKWDLVSRNYFTERWLQFLFPLLSLFHVIPYSGDGHDLQLGVEALIYMNFKKWISVVIVG